MFDHIQYWVREKQLCYILTTIKITEIEIDIIRSDTEKKLPAPLSCLSKGRRDKRLKKLLKKLRQYRDTEQKLSRKMSAYLAS